MVWENFGIGEMDLSSPLKRAVTAPCSLVLWSVGTESLGCGTQDVSGKSPGLEGQLPLSHSVSMTTLGSNLPLPRLLQSLFPFSYSVQHLCSPSAGAVVFPQLHSVWLLCSEGKGIIILIPLSTFTTLLCHCFNPCLCPFSLGSA